MRKNKVMKLTAIGLALTMGIMTVGCGKGSENESSQNTQSTDNTQATAENQTPAPAELSDSSSSGEHTFYPSAFEAKGSEAEAYNGRMERYEAGFAEYFKGTGELEKVSGYDEPIQVTTTNWYTASIEDAISKIGEGDGETLNYNRWNDIFKRLYNIDVSYSWWAQDADYTQKLRLDMTAGELPDIFLVRDQSDLLSLASQGLIWDMTDLIDQYASDYDKNSWASDEGAALEMATLDGRIYGLPSIQSATDAVSYIWFRDDWMQKLNLEYPTTTEELSAVMDAFVTQDPDGNGADDTWGLYLYGTDLIYPLKGIYAAFGSYPDSWYEESDQNVVYGGITESTKNAIAYVADLYQKGYINPEFVAQDATKAQEDIMNNKVGIVYAGHWFGHTAGDLHELNPDSDWKCIPLPSVDGKDVRSLLKPTQQGWVAVNKNFQHPEIALKMRTATSYALLCEDSAWWWYDQNVSWNISPVRCNVTAWDNLVTYQNLQEAYENGDDESLLKAKGVSYWANLHGENQWEWELMFGPGEGTAFSVLEKYYDADLLFWDAFHGEQSALMQERWSSVKDQQSKFFTDMIIGRLSVEEGFAQWVDTFNNSLDGIQMTEEVKAWCQEHNQD